MRLHPCFLAGYSSILLHCTRAASYSPTLDVTDPTQLKLAAAQAMSNLMSYYVPSTAGAFDQINTPWHESGMIWCMHFDYVKWTGDTQFMPIVIGALVNSSYTTSHDFLGGDQVKVVEMFLGRWNDDILWPSQAVVAGAEIYGPNSLMGFSGGDWISLAVKTYDQAASQTDNKCGGGIYWSRDRGSTGGSYKSLITQLEFIAQGARNYIQTKNETALQQTKQILDWVTSSGIGNSQTGILFDGVGVGACSNFTTYLWTYNYGQLLGALAWMHKATGQQKYLDMTVPYYTHAVEMFAGTNTSGVIAELCESDITCNRDQQGFKAIFVRNLAYLYRQTNNSTMKTSISNIIDTSLKAMIDKSCDKNWNCGGNWTTDTQPVKYVRSQHVSTALLVAALGVRNNPGAGLLPTVSVGVSTTNSTTSSGRARSQVKSSAPSSQSINFKSMTSISIILSIINSITIMTNL